jgi:hypothetical protein
MRMIGFGCKYPVWVERYTTVLLGGRRNPGLVEGFSLNKVFVKDDHYLFADSKDNIPISINAYQKRQLSHKNRRHYHLSITMTLLKERINALDIYRHFGFIS